jgi:hypothetical protein
VPGNPTATRSCTAWAAAASGSSTVCTGRRVRRAPTRRSAELHPLAAELAGNTALARSMRELSVPTCLMIILCDAPTTEVDRKAIFPG